MKDIYLFNAVSFDSYVATKTERIKQELLNSSKRILNEDSSILAKQIAEKHYMEAPIMDYDSLKTTVVPRQVMHFRRPVMTHFVEYEFQFKGNSELLECKPSNAACGIGYPVVITLSGNKIAFEVNSGGIVTNGGQPMERVKMYAKAVFDFIDCNLESLNISIDSWNSTLEEELRVAIADRRSQLQAIIDKKKEIDDGLNPFK